MNTKSQIAILQKIVDDVTAPAAYRARSAETIRRYGLPIEEQQAIAAAEFEAWRQAGRQAGRQLPLPLDP